MGTPLHARVTEVPHPSERSSAGANSKSIRTPAQPAQTTAAEARDRLVSRGRVLIPYENAVPQSVQTDRMGEDRRPIHRRIADVVHQWPARGVARGEVANPLRDFMIRTSCIAAHSQPADYGTVGVVKRNTAAEGDNATGELILTTSGA